MSCLRSLKPQTRSSPPPSAAAVPSPHNPTLHAYTHTQQEESIRELQAQLEAKDQELAAARREAAAEADAAVVARMQVRCALN